MSTKKPVFIGGTGRSGTTIVARLLGAHPAYHAIPIEVRFLVDPGGLCDLAEGRTTYRKFKRKMLRRWFYREIRNGETRGLHELLDRETLEAALHRLDRELATEPWKAGGDFVHRLLDPMAAGDDAQGWLEMTPPNALAAPSLLRLFPDMKLLHVVRDGRDVACSVALAIWGPDDVDEALDWWADRLEKGLAAGNRLPPDRVLVIQMEDLVKDDREREYTRLREFLELDDDPAMRAFFESTVSGDRAHIGRWVDQVPASRRPAFEAHYRDLVASLRERGHTVRSADSPDA